MRIARIIYDRPLLATGTVFLACAAIVAIASELQIAPTWANLYQSMAVFPHFDHVMTTLKACGTESRAAIFAMAGAIAPLAYWLLLGLVGLELFSRFSKWVAASRDIWHEVGDNTPPSSHALGGLRFGLAMVLLAVATGCIRLYWHFQARSADEISIACSSRTLTSDYWSLRYPLVAGIACYCVIQAIKGAVFFMRAISVWPRP